MLRVHLYYYACVVYSHRFRNKSCTFILLYISKTQRLHKLSKKYTTGADPGFQVRGGAHLKKLRRAEGGAKILGVFRV